MAANPSVASAAGSAALNAGSVTLGAIHNAGSSVAGAVGSRVVKYETSTVIKLMRSLNILNAIGLMACGIVILVALPICLGNTGCPGPATAILAFYVFFFGLLLFLFEARMSDTHEAFMRRYMGFMFGYWGRFFFILFVGSMTMGIVNTVFALWWVPAIVGGVTLLNALLNCFIIRNHPGFQSGEAQAQELQQQQQARSGLNGLGSASVMAEETHSDPFAGASGLSGGGAYPVGGGSSNAYANTSAYNSTAGGYATTGSAYEEEPSNPFAMERV